MKFFIIVSCIVFLVVSHYSDTIWGIYLIGSKEHPEYLEGLGVIPVIALSYVFLGIYYNLTVWYKLTDKTIYGAYITLIGAVVTILINYFTIPYLGYWGSAWATLICYGLMMQISYKQGQKYYPIPYVRKKLTAYIIISILVYLIYFGISRFTDHAIIKIAIAVILLVSFVYFIGRIEHKEFARIPYLGRFFSSPVRAAPLQSQASDNMKA